MCENGGGGGGGCIGQGIVHQDMKSSWKCTHPHGIQDVDEFFFLHGNIFGEI